MNILFLDDLIKKAIKEDINNFDLTADSLFSEEHYSTVDLIAKENGVICGLSIFEKVFKILDSTSSFKAFFKDGDKVKSGDLLGVLTGQTRALLSGERTALNLLQRMSGISTTTKKYVEILKGSSLKLADTRKTLPNMRILDKYAVKIGGGINHRFNLSDAVMLKDNHISAVGGIKEAVSLVRKNISFVNKIEVEVENLESVKEAIEANVDIIMLDNMNKEEMEKAISLINNKAIIEISGNISIENLLELKDLKANIISSGAITHSVKALDISMKNMKAI